LRQKPTKKPVAFTNGLFVLDEARLLKLRFFVLNVLTRNRIELPDDEFFAHRLFVLGRRVEMAGTGGGFEFDFFTHDVVSFELDRASGAHIGENGVDALLVDQTDACGGETDADEAVFAFNPEAAALQIGQEAALGFVVGVRNIVSHHRLFAGDLTYASHDSNS
jgi:hypothetical protein